MTKISGRSTEKGNLNFVDPNIFEVQRELERVLGYRIQIVNKKNNSGKLVVEYKNLDQLEYISNLLKNKSKS